MRSCTPAAVLLMLAVAAATCCTPATAACSFDVNPSIQPPGKCMDNKGMSRDDNYGYCASKILENCKDTANIACRVCSLYFVAHDELCADLSHSGGKPVDTQHCITSTAPSKSPVKGSETTIQIATADVNSHTRHWKIVPKFAIRGNEDIGSKVADDLNQLWRDGVAALGSLPFGASTTSMNPDTTGFVNNGPAVRTNHQLHIHIGTINSNVKSMLSKAPSHYKQGQWNVLESNSKFKIIIKCSSSMDAFSEYSSALGSTDWPAKYKDNSGKQYDAKYYTTVMLVKGPSWSNSHFCTILLRDKGDADLLTY